MEQFIRERAGCSESSGRYWCIINREYKQSTDTWYLSFKQIKTRAKNPTINYFAHPFEHGNGMRLIEDFNLKEPVSLKTISDDLATNDQIASKGRISARHKHAITDNDDKEEDNKIEEKKLVVLGGDENDFEGLQ